MNPWATYTHSLPLFVAPVHHHQPPSIYLSIYLPMWCYTALMAHLLTTLSHHWHSTCLECTMPPAPAHNFLFVATEHARLPRALPCNILRRTSSCSLSRPLIWERRAEADLWPGFPECRRGRKIPHRSLYTPTADHDNRVIIACVYMCSWLKGNLMRC